MDKPRLFHFEKWYFDLALPSGEVIFFFLAATRILGRKDFRLSLTATAPGRAPVHRSLVLDGPAGGRRQAGEALRLPEFGGGPPTTLREIPVTVAAGDLEVDLVFRRRAPSNVPAQPMIISRGRRRVRWEPVQSRSDVDGTVRAAGRTWSAAGCAGYIDRLTTDIFPLFTPVRTLYWGRLHHARGTLVYTVIPSPQPAARLTWESERNRLEFDGVEVLERRKFISPALGLAFPAGYSLTACRASSNVRLEVENIAPAVETGFIAAEGLRNRFESRALAFLARDPRGIKFFSKAHGLIGDGGRSVEIKDAPLFSEVVRFG